MKRSLNPLLFLSLFFTFTIVGQPLSSASAAAPEPAPSPAPARAVRLRPRATASDGGGNNASSPAADRRTPESREFSGGSDASAPETGYREREPNSPYNKEVALIYVAATVFCMAISAFTYYVFYRVFFIRRFSPAPRAFRSSWMNTAGELLEWRANVDGAVGGLDPSHVAALPVLPYHSRSVKSPVIATKTDASSINLEKENNRLVSLPHFTPNERDAETKESSSPEASGRAEKGLIDKMICMRECAVCLCDFLEGEEVKVLPECGHFFHVKCVDQWLFFHPTCPICRLSLRPTPT